MLKLEEEKLPEARLKRRLLRVTWKLDRLRPTPVKVKVLPESEQLE